MFYRYGYYDYEISKIKEDDEVCDYYNKCYKSIICEIKSFKDMIENYKKSDDLDNLINNLDFIIENILYYQSDNNSIDSKCLALMNTKNWFVFSFFAKGDEIGNYVFLTKDQKNLVITREFCESDEERMNKNERYGMCDINYYDIDDYNEEVHHMHVYREMCTSDYESLLASPNYHDKDYDRILSNIKRLIKV